MKKRTATTLTRERVSRCLKTKEQHPPQWRKARNLQRAVSRAYASGMEFEEAGRMYSLSKEHVRTLVERFVLRIEANQPDPDPASVTDGRMPSVVMGPKQ